jgi:hypothetical protein
MGWVSLVDGVLVGSDSTGSFVSVEQHSSFVVFNSNLTGPEPEGERCDLDWYCSEFFRGRRDLLFGVVAELASVEDFLFRVNWLKLRLGGVRGVVPVMGNRTAVGFTFGSLHDVAGDVYGDEPHISDFDFLTIESIARTGVAQLHARALLLADFGLSEALREGVFLWSHMFDGNDVAEVVRSDPKE